MLNMNVETACWKYDVALFIRTFSFWDADHCRWFFSWVSRRRRSNQQTCRLSWYHQMLEHQPHFLAHCGSRNWDGEMDQISQTWNIKHQTDQASRHPTYVPPKMVLPATTPTGKGFRESVTIVQSLKTKHVTDLIVALTDLIATFTALSHDRWSIP